MAQLMPQKSSLNLSKVSRHQSASSHQSAAQHTTQDSQPVSIFVIEEVQADEAAHAVSNQHGLAAIILLYSLLDQGCHVVKGAYLHSMGTGLCKCTSRCDNLCMAFFG